MDLFEFNALTENEKESIIFNSPCVGERHEELYTILLFQVSSFYVELYYSNKKSEKERIRAFSSTDQLEPYLQKIDFNLLLQ